MKKSVLGKAIAKIEAEIGNLQFVLQKLHEQVAESKPKAKRKVAKKATAELTLEPPTH